MNTLDELAARISRLKKSLPEQLQGRLAWVVSQSEFEDLERDLAKQHSEVSAAIDLNQLIICGMPVVVWEASK